MSRERSYQGSKTHVSGARRGAPGFLPGLLVFDTMERGFFLTFEGLDGSGKSTQLRMLAAALRARDLPVVETRQPGGTAFGDRLRAVLLQESGTAPLDAHTELALMFADRAQLIAEVVAPALRQRELLLCDRWTDSTEAYQGGGRLLGSSAVQRLHQDLCDGLQPDLTILLLPAIQVSLARARRRNERQQAQGGSPEGRFEAESDLFFHRVYAQYQIIAARESVRVVVIDADEPVEAIHARILKVVMERLHGWIGS